MICPKCGHKRTSLENHHTPKEQCPSCGVFYFKYVSQQNNAKHPETHHHRKPTIKTKIRTHYDNLKVARDAPFGVIKAAYQALSVDYQSDKHQCNKGSAEKILNHIKASYEVLIDPIKREAYDDWIRDQESTRLEGEGRTNKNAAKIFINAAKCFIDEKLISKILLGNIIEKIPPKRLPLFKYSAVFLVASLILIATNYALLSNDISGTIFIKTRGADNIKLGLVDVKALPLTKSLLPYVEWPEVLFSVHDANEVGSVQSVTNAEGRFNLRLKRGLKYILTAKASRYIYGGDVEIYKWALVIDGKSTEEIILSNNNMIN